MKLFMYIIFLIASIACIVGGMLVTTTTNEAMHFLQITFTCLVGLCVAMIINKN